MHQKPGYAGKILRVNLSIGQVLTVPTEIYAERFLGGRGVAIKIYWDEAPPEVNALAPENLLAVTTGPIGGVPGFAGSRWQISGKSPLQHGFSYGNLGGAWGAQLKFAGYDGLVVQGRADKLTCLVIDQDKVELREASHLKGQGAIAVREALKKQLGPSFRVLAVGPAGENLVTFATILADSDSSGAGGLGAVMGAKNLKAIAVRGRNKIEVADPSRAAHLKAKLRELNFKAFPPPTHILPRERLKKDVCFGCIDGCIRRTYTSRDGLTGKYMCQSRFFYETRARRYYGQPSEVSFLATKLCDDHGLDATVVETMIMWLSRCHKAGLLNETETGLPLSKLGSLEFIETLVHTISHREGFGDLLAEGTLKAAQSLGRGSEDYITDYMTKTGESAIYGSRIYLTTGLLYALEPRQPIQQLHEISAPALLWAARQTGLEDNFMTSQVIRQIAHRFWGGEIAADFSTYEGKAMAAARIQDRQYAKECLILCDLSWPVLFSPQTPDHVGDPSL
ncbi:MAG: aldehyde ferredoxin oxidoreductase N-terminal domain-containing protein, partial [Pseudomonadota bacterium]